MQRVGIIVFFVLSCTLVAKADEQVPTDERSTFDYLGPEASDHVGLEASLLWPLFPGNLFQVRGAISLTKTQHLVVGLMAHIPHDRSDEGRFSSVGASIGWRGYLWGGLHLEAMFNMGRGRLRDSVANGADYLSFDMELMALAGWRFDVGPVYALIQPLGIASVIYRSNPWPVAGVVNTSERPIYVGNIVLGVQL